MTPLLLSLLYILMGVGFHKLDKGIHDCALFFFINVALWPVGLAVYAITE